MNIPSRNSEYSSRSFSTRMIKADHSGTMHRMGNGYWRPSFVVLHIISTIATVLFLLLLRINENASDCKRPQFGLVSIFVAITCFGSALGLLQLPRMEHRWEMDPRPLVPVLAAFSFVGAG